MHSVDLLEEAIALAKQAGFDVRHEWLDETGGGACRIGNRQVLYVNLSLTAADQLQQVLTALRASPNAAKPGKMSSQLRSLLG